LLPEPLAVRSNLIAGRLGSDSCAHGGLRAGLHVTYHNGPLDSRFYSKITDLYTLNSLSRPVELNDPQKGMLMTSDERHDHPARKPHPAKSLPQFFRQSPLVGVDLDLERANDEARDIELGASYTEPTDS